VGYSKQKFACIATAAFQVNMSALRVWFALVRVVFATVWVFFWQTHTSNNTVLLIYIAQSKDMMQFWRQQLHTKKLPSYVLLLVSVLLASPVTLSATINVILITHIHQYSFTQEAQVMQRNQWN